MPSSWESCPREIRAPRRAYHRLNDFRSDHGDVFSELVTQRPARLMKYDLIDLHRVAQDGTRIRASAGAASFRSGETLHHFTPAVASDEALPGALAADPWPPPHPRRSHRRLAAPPGAANRAHAPSCPWRRFPIDETRVTRASSSRCDSFYHRRDDRWTIRSFRPGHRRPMSLSAHSGPEPRGASDSSRPSQTRSRYSFEMVDGWTGTPP